MNERRKEEPGMKGKEEVKGKAGRKEGSIQV